MSKRFYIVLFCVLSLSVVLLGFSFAKESGDNGLASLESGSTDEYRVVYSNNQRLDTVENDTVSISLINKMKEEAKFYLVLEEINNTSYDNLYYTIDDGTKKEMLSNEIYLGELNSFGTNGDFTNHTIKLINDSDKDLEFKLSIKKYDKNNFSALLKENDSVYIDDRGNYRFFGKEVNNYIKYNAEVCRIIGLIDDEIKIICEPKNLNVFDDSTSLYANIDDILLSFNNSDVNVNNVNNYSSWIVIDKDFWLEESYGITYYISRIEGIKTSTKDVSLYERYVYKLNDDMILIGGDGTKNNPYEVSYGS